MLSVKYKERFMSNKFKKAMQIIEEGLLKPMSNTDIEEERAQRLQQHVKEQSKIVEDCMSKLKAANCKPIPIVNEIAVEFLDGRIKFVLYNLNQTKVDNVIQYYKIVEQILDFAKKNNIHIDSSDVLMNRYDDKALSNSLNFVFYLMDGSKKQYITAFNALIDQDSYESTSGNIVSVITYKFNTVKNKSELMTAANKILHEAGYEYTSAPHDLRMRSGMKLYSFDSFDADINIANIETKQIDTISLVNKDEVRFISVAEMEKKLKEYLNAK